MSKTIFILGAGASKAAGAPLMADFITTAEDLLNRNVVEKEKEDFLTVLEARQELQNIFSKASFDVSNIESVFAAFEMAQIIQKFGNYPVEKINSLSNSMKKVIVKTIESSMEFRVITKSSIPIIAPSPYPSFVNLVEKILQEKQEDVSIFTFNYDLALDVAFANKGIQIDYGLENQGIPVLKLHGSLNWGECAECNKIIPVTIDQYFDKFYLIDKNEKINFFLNLPLEKFNHCNKPLLHIPFIVPPTWNKNTYYDKISPIWIRAALEMSNAENIFVIGYSFPETDKFFHYLYALGTVGKNFLKRFWVYNPDENVESKFRKIIGGAAADKSCSDFRKMTFKNAIVDLEENFLDSHSISTKTVSYI